MSPKVTPDMVKELRERTGVGMGKCKEALDQAHGDMEKAIDLLRKSGMASAVKKEGRETKGRFATVLRKERERRCSCRNPTQRPISSLKMRDSSNSCAGCC